MALQYVTFCATDEIPVGSREVFDLDRMSIVLFNVDGAYYAVEDMCSHEEYELHDGDLDGFVLKCPKHGATFDIRNGDFLSAPAYFPIKSFPVRVEDGNVQVGLDLD